MRLLSVLRRRRHDRDVVLHEEVLRKVAHTLLRDEEVGLQGDDHLALARDPLVLDVQQGVEVRLVLQLDVGL